MVKRRMTSFLAGRIVEAFAAGMGVVAIAYRFHLSRDRAEVTLRRHARRRRDR